jgi:hypothetical protein
VEKRWNIETRTSPFSVTIPLLHDFIDSHDKAAVLLLIKMGLKIEALDHNDEMPLYIWQ